MYYYAKKNFGAIRKFLKFCFFLKFLSFFSKNFFLDRSEIFFCIVIHKKLNKSCSLNKKFLFLKKKVVSLKKTKICRIFKTNWEIFLPVHSPNLYGISIWKMHGRSHGNFFICFGDFQQQCMTLLERIWKYALETKAGT